MYQTGFCWREENEANERVMMPLTVHDSGSFTILRALALNTTSVC